MQNMSRGSREWGHRTNTVVENGFETNTRGPNIYTTITAFLYGIYNFSNEKSRNSLIKHTDKIFPFNGQIAWSFVFS